MWNWGRGWNIISARGLIKLDGFYCNQQLTGAHTICNFPKWRSEYRGSEKLLYYFLSRDKLSWYRKHWKYHWGWNRISYRLQSPHSRLCTNGKNIVKSLKFFTKICSDKTCFFLQPVSKITPLSSHFWNPSQDNREKNKSYHCVWKWLNYWI